VDTRTFFYLGRGVCRLEKILEKRAGRRSLGSTRIPRQPRSSAQYGIAGASAAGDLIRYGLIPEFVAACRRGRDETTGQGRR